jgi:hypothetical protein
MIVDVGLGEASGIAAVKQILSSSFVPYVFVTGSTLSGLSLGPEYGPHPKALPRVGPGSSNSEGAVSGSMSTRGKKPRA